MRLPASRGSGLPVSRVATRAGRASAGILSQLVLEWKLHRDVRPGPGSAADMDRAAQGLDPVGKAGQARTAGGIGPADAVVADRQHQAAIDRGQRHLTGTPIEERTLQSWEATWPITPDTSL